MEEVDQDNFARIECSSPCCFQWNWKESSFSTMGILLNDCDITEIPRIAAMTVTKPGMSLVSREAKTAFVKIRLGDS